MHSVQTSAELRQQLGHWRKTGEAIALVPTMGNLHRGHLSLVAEARKAAQRVVVSIFVNPLQFGPNEDYARYPRTLEADTRMLREAGADLLFAPEVAEIYPNAYPPSTTVRITGPLTEQLDGLSRPGHFDGVATVVNILFNRIQPDIAIFGEKDYQQLAVVRRMVSDLGLPIKVLGAPTQRDADGLALSSRNQYLSAEERAIAPMLHRTIEDAAEAIRAGRRDFEAICAEQNAALQQYGFAPDYFEIRTADLSPPAFETSEFVVLAAARLGRTRLIDNLALNLQPGSRKHFD